MNPNCRRNVRRDTRRAAPVRSVFRCTAGATIARSSISSIDAPKELRTKMRQPNPLSCGRANRETITKTVLRSACGPGEKASDRAPPDFTVGGHLLQLERVVFPVNCDLCCKKRKPRFGPMDGRERYCRGDNPRDCGFSGYRFDASEGTSYRPRSQRGPLVRDRAAPNSLHAPANGWIKRSEEPQE